MIRRLARDVRGLVVLSYDVSYLSSKISNVAEARNECEGAMATRQACHKYQELVEVHMKACSWTIRLIDVKRQQYMAAVQKRQNGVGRQKPREGSGGKTRDGGTERGEHGKERETTMGWLLLLFYSLLFSSLLHSTFLWDADA